MSYATIYIIVVFIIPAALGVLLLTLVSLDGIDKMQDSYGPKPVKTPQSHNRGNSLPIGALFHHGAA